MNIQGPTDFQHEGHMGFSEKGIEAFNLPPDWQNLLNNLNKTLQAMGVEGLSKEEAQLLLTGKLGVTQDDFGEWGSADKTRPSARTTPPPNKAQSDFKRVAGPGTNRGRRFVIGNSRESSPNSSPSRARNSIQRPNSIVRSTSEAHFGHSLPGNAVGGDNEYELGAMQAKLEEQASRIVRLQTESESSTAEWERRFAQVQSDLEDTKAKLRVRTQDLTQLKIESHTQASALVERDKLLHKLQNEKTKWQEDSSRLSPRASEDLGSHRFIQSLQEKMKSQQLIHLEELAFLQQQRQQETLRLREEQESRQKLEQTHECYLASLTQQHAAELLQQRSAFEAQLVRLQESNGIHWRQIQEEAERMREEKQTSLDKVQQLENKIAHYTAELRNQESRANQLESENALLLTSSSESTSNLQRAFTAQSSDLLLSRTRESAAIVEIEQLRKQLKVLQLETEELRVAKANEGSAKERALVVASRFEAMLEDSTNKHKEFLEQSQSAQKQLEGEKRDLEAALREAETKILSSSDSGNPDQTQAFELQLGEMSRSFNRQIQELEEQLDSARKETRHLMNQTTSLQQELSRKETLIAETLSYNAEIEANLTCQLSLSEKERARLELNYEEERRKLFEALSEQAKLQDSLQLQSAQSLEKEKVLTFQMKELSVLQMEMDRIRQELSSQRETLQLRIDSLQSSCVEQERTLLQLQKDRIDLDNALASTQLQLQSSTLETKNDIHSLQASHDEELHKFKSAQTEREKDLQSLIANLERDLEKASRTISEQRDSLLVLESEKSDNSLKGINMDSLAHAEDLLSTLRTELESERALRFRLEEVRGDLLAELERATLSLTQLESGLSSLRSSRTELEVQNKQQKEKIESLQLECNALKVKVTSNRTSIFPTAKTPSNPSISIKAPPPPPPPIGNSSLPPIVLSKEESQKANPDIFVEIRGGKSLKRVEVRSQPLLRSS